MPNRKHDRSMVPANDAAPDGVPNLPSINSDSYAERRTAEKYREHHLREGLKAIETIQAGEMVKAVDQEIEADGVEMIDYRRSLIDAADRNAEDQAWVEKFTRGFTEKSLHDL